MLLVLKKLIMERNWDISYRDIETRMPLGKIWDTAEKIILILWETICFSNASLKIIIFFISKWNISYTRIYNEIHLKFNDLMLLCIVHNDQLLTNNNKATYYRLEHAISFFFKTQNKYNVNMLLVYIWWTQQCENFSKEIFC